MCELSDEDFKRTSIKTLKAIMNTLETNGKLEYLSKEVEEKKTNENLELKNTISKMKTLTEWTQSQNGDYRRVSKLEDGSMQIIQSA